MLYIKKMLLLFYVAFIITIRTSEQCYDYSRVSSEEKKFELIGLFPINVTGSIEPEVLVWSEAFKYFIEESNKENEMFYYRMYDLCWNEDYDLLTNVSLDIILQSDENILSSVCSCAPRNFELYKTLGIVGAANSFNTEYINQLVRFENLTMISYASTNQALSDNQKYPNVLRTIPSDPFQSNTIKEVLHRMNWTYVSLIYEDNSYGRSGQAALALSNTCLAIDEFLKSDHSNLDHIFDSLKGNTKSNVIILWGSFDMSKAILERAAKENFSGMVWVLSDASGKKPWFLEFTKTFNAHLYHIIPFSGQSKRFEEHFLNLTYEDSLTSKSWLKQFFQQQNDITNSTSLKEFERLFDFSLVGFVRNAVLSYVNALLLLLVKYCSPLLKLSDCDISVDSSFNTKYIKTLLSNTFMGLDGQLVAYTNTGDIKSAAFDIYTIRILNDTPEFVRVASWSSQNALYDIDIKEYSTVSKIRSDCFCEPGMHIAEDSKNCCPSCVPCPSIYYKPMMGNQNCTKCPKGMIAVADKTKCKLVKPAYIKFTSYEAIILFVASFVGIIVTMATLFLFIKFRDTPLIRSSNLHMSVIQLFGHLMVFLLPLLFIDKDYRLKCQIRTFGVCFFFVLILTISLSKITHIVQVFSVKLKLTKWEVRQQKTNKFLIIIVSMVIDICITLTVSSVHPIDINEIETTDYKVYYECVSNDHFLAHVVYVILLQIICGIQSFRGRHLPGKYNEAKYTSFAMFTSTLVLVTAMPLTSSATNLNTKQLVLACALVLANFFILFSLYGYKVIIIFFYPKENTKEIFQKKRLQGIVSSMTITTLNSSICVVQQPKNPFGPKDLKNVIEYNEEKFRKTSCFTDDESEASTPPQSHVDPSFELDANDDGESKIKPMNWEYDNKAFGNNNLTNDLGGWMVAVVGHKTTS